MVDNFEGQIDTTNLGAFLESAGYNSSDIEQLAIIRRMDADGDATVTFTEWADFLRPIAALARPAPVFSSSLLGPYPSWRHRYGYWPYSSYSPYSSSLYYPYSPSYRHSYLPYSYASYLPSYSAYRPYYRSPLSTYVPSYTPTYLPASYSYSAPRYTHTTYEPASTYTTYEPLTVTTHEPVTTYHTRVVPSYKLVTETTDYVTTPVRTTVSTSPSHYYSPYAASTYYGAHSYRYTSPYHRSFLW